MKILTYHLYIISSLLVAMQLIRKSSETISHILIQGFLQISLSSS